LDKQKCTDVTSVIQRFTLNLRIEVYNKSYLIMKWWITAMVFLSTCTYVCRILDYLYYRWKH